MPADDNLDLQVSRYSTDGYFSPGATWRGTPIELGGRGRLVKLWSVHYSVSEINDDPTTLDLWYNALSSNPEHQGDYIATTDAFFQDKALYGTAVFGQRINKSATGGASRWVWTQIIPLHGLIRPRRQIWVLFRNGWAEWYQFGMEIYYSEIPMLPGDIITANRKYGKYRRS